MRIGFDAKRAFYNASGLGNYSRNLICNLSKFAPNNEYVLFKNKQDQGIPFNFSSENTSVVIPENFLGKNISSYWRSFGMSKDICRNNLDIYHGLSHELPIGIDKLGIKSIVTMHDVIFLRFPELFSPSYRYIFKKKYKFACNHADAIVAISEQSKLDVIKYFNVPENKIKVVYQGCNPIFYNRVSLDIKFAVRKKYHLPENFLLYVGTIEKRKNALSIIKALHLGNIDFPLVIVGRPTAYMSELETYIEVNNMQSQIIFLHDVSTVDLPAFYQMSSVFILPSLFEGFGIPILEALNSGTPVITSKGSCFPEVGGTVALYVEYGNDEEMIDSLKKVLNSDELRNEMISAGYKQAENFKEEKLTIDMINIYNNVL